MNRNLPNDQFDGSDPPANQNGPLMRHALMSASLNPVPTLKSLRSAVTGPVSLDGKTVLITGASSGIGKSAVELLAGHGAHIIAVARDYDQLTAVCTTATGRGGSADAMPCDLTDAEQVLQLKETVVDRFGVPDVIVNNAGRSIRRTAAEAADRVHDYERTMAINYFGAVRLTLAFLPNFQRRGCGHFVNVATWGTTAGVMPKFTAYHASKAALAAFGRSLGAELHDTDIAVSTLGFPLVRTDMISPTADYDSQPALTSKAAAKWILTAIRDRPTEMYPAYTGLLRSIGVVSPRLTDALVRATGI